MQRLPLLVTSGSHHWWLGRIFEAVLSSSACRVKELLRETLGEKTCDSCCLGRNAFDEAVNVQSGKVIMRLWKETCLQSKLRILIGFNEMNAFCQSATCAIVRKRVRGHGQQDIASEHPPSGNRAQHESNLSEACLSLTFLSLVRRCTSR